MGVRRMASIPLELIAERVQEKLRALPEVAGAYLFGSAVGEDPAAGDADTIGDIDIGLVMRTFDERDAERLSLQVEGLLGSIDGKAFHVTVLDEREVPFVMKVLREGRLVHAADIDMVADFIERVSLAWREIGLRYLRARSEVLEEVRADGDRP